MRELVEAAVQAAARAGVVAVIVGGGSGGGNGYHDPIPQPLPAGAPPDAVARFNAATARVQELEAHLRTQAASLNNVLLERDQYSARLREAETTLRAAPAGVPVAGSPIPVAPNLDGQPISILGLDEEEIGKKLTKKGILTVGALRMALLAGNLATDVKLSKDRIISVGEALLGKAPPATLPGVGTAPAGSVPSAIPANGTPAGHMDRPWPERLQAARKKERQRNELTGEVARMEAELKVVTDPAAKAKLEGEVRTKMGTFDVIGGQVFCLLWSCGLYADPTKAPKNVRDVNVDAALKDAGLMQFMETPPAPQDAPAPAPPPAATA